jgi:hypothetical protein
MRIVQILRRDLGQQFRIANNLGESRRTKAARAFWSAFYVLKGLRIGLRSMASESLGSQVIYKGRECTVCNWAGSETPTLCGDAGYYEEFCDRKQIKNVRNLREFRHRFIVGFGHYMSCWHGIDVQRRLY